MKKHFGSTIEERVGNLEVGDTYHRRVGSRTYIDPLELKSVRREISDAMDYFAMKKKMVFSLKEFESGREVNIYLRRLE